MVEGTHLASKSTTAEPSKYPSYSLKVNPFNSHDFFYRLFARHKLIELIANGLVVAVKHS
jgi:hypothetical protein